MSDIKLLDDDDVPSRFWARCPRCSTRFRLPVGIVREIFDMAPGGEPGCGTCAGASLVLFEVTP